MDRIDHIGKVNAANNIMCQIIDSTIGFTDLWHKKYFSKCRGWKRLGKYVNKKEWEILKNIDRNLIINYMMILEVIVIPDSTKKEKEIKYIRDIIKSEYDLCQTLQYETAPLPKRWDEPCVYKSPKNDPWGK